MISEPLAGKRETVVKQTRTAIDFAEILRYTADELYPKAKKIILVTDNLNIHAPSSLYKAFSAQEANRLTKRFEWHYTPKHGSWLDMAEIEIGVMSRQALAKPFPDLESFEKQVRSWTVNRNAKCVKINWQFTTADARIKLAKLYPTTLHTPPACTPRYISQSFITESYRSSSQKTRKLRREIMRMHDFCTSRSVLPVRS